MQPTGFLVLTLAATLSLPLAGQTSAADAQAEARAAQQNAITDRYLTAVQVMMASKVDTKNAVVGQEVSAKTLAEARLADGTVLPKGTRLVGHVTQVRAGGPEQGSGVLTLAFDQAEVRPGQNVSVRCVIRAVAPSSPTTASPIMAGPPTMMSGTGSTVNRTGHGTVAGMPGTTVPSPGGGAGGGPVSTIPDGMPDSTGGGMGGAGTAGSAGPSLGGSGPIIAENTTNMGSTANMPATRKVVDAGESVSGAPRATGLPGVLLWSTPMASGMLTAMGRNISLESGMQMTLGVITR